jgi:hypothetical protein
VKIPDAIDFTRETDRSLDHCIRFAASRSDSCGFYELLTATKAGRIGFTAILNRRAVWTPRSLRSSLPTIVLISDDAGDSRDPDQWRCSMSVIAWARCAIIHGCGAEAWHYQAAISAAEDMSRVLFVETDSAHAAAWGAAIAPREIPVLSVLVAPGKVHPIGTRL